jgi:hypothetical protein
MVNGPPLRYSRACNIPDRNRPHKPADDAA